MATRSVGISMYLSTNLGAHQCGLDGLSCICSDNDAINKS
jgi:hypothetical protein